MTHPHFTAQELAQIAHEAQLLYLSDGRLEQAWIDSTNLMPYMERFTALLNERIAQKMAGGSK